ncbi:MAG: helix-turn-helix domain-containing protein [Nostocaceae cyanobacterium]|nr:helix-turn-helix domain-containing protein [Nostocaceae cyanobacterium]
MTSTYSITIPGTPTIEISRDELRSLLGEIEAQLHRSQVYRRALANLQNLLGESSEQAKILFKAVSREAIGLAFRQFAHKSQKAASHQKTGNNSNSLISSTQTPENANDLTSYLTTTKFQQANEKVNHLEDSLPSQSLGENHPASDSANALTTNTTKKTAFKWFQRQKNTGEEELAKPTPAQQRLEKLRHIGQQFKQARESQGISVTKLNADTHVPIHHIQAFEKGNVELLPEDVYLRGFIRTLGNALRLNGNALAASFLPASEPAKTVLPSAYKPQKSNDGLRLELSPMHLYVGYTALIAGAVGGLSFVSQQQANTKQDVLPKADTTSSDVSESFRDKEPITKPGLQSSNGSVTVGSDISRPETLF